MEFSVQYGYSLFRRGSFSGETARKRGKQRENGKIKKSGLCGGLLPQLPRALFPFSSFRSPWKDESDLCGGERYGWFIIILHFAYSYPQTQDIDMNIPLTTLLCVLLITLCSASDNSSSSKPHDNKVSSFNPMVAASLFTLTHH